MNKYIYGALTTLLTFACLTGCASSNNKQDMLDGEGMINVTVEEQDDNQPVVLDNVAPGSTAEVNPNYLALKDAGIVASGISLFVGDDFKPNIDNVGEAEIVEGQACLDDGFDTNYYYNDEDLVVYTLAKDGKQIIYDIYVSSEDYMTLKGAKVGTSVEDLLSLYGDPNDTVGSTYVYYVETQDTKLQFEIDSSKNSVKSIDLIRN